MKQKKGSKKEKNIKLATICGYTFTVDKYNFMTVNNKTYNYYRTLRQALLGIKDKIERENLYGPVIDLNKAIDKIEIIYNRFIEEMDETFKKYGLNGMKGEVTEDFLISSLISMINRGWITEEEVKQRINAGKRKSKILKEEEVD